MPRRTLTAVAAVATFALGATGSGAAAPDDSPAPPVVVEVRGGFACEAAAVGATAMAGLLLVAGAVVAVVSGRRRPSARAPHRGTGGSSPTPNRKEFE